MPDCLICGRETSATHLGMDACRACTVFFRRHRGSQAMLQCMKGSGNCKEYRQGIYSCQKCRMDRFNAVIAAGRSSEEIQKMDTTTPSPFTSSDSPVEVPDGVSLHFNEPMQIPSASIPTAPATPTHSIIDKIRSSYRSLCLMRRTAEFQFRGIFLDPFEADREDYDLVPCTYKIMNESTRILIIGLFDFIPAIFPEFNGLPVADKWLLIRNCQKIFLMLDSSVRSQRRCGDDNKIIFGSYTTYLSPDAVDIYFSDCPEQKNVAEAARTLRDCIQENCIKGENTAPNERLTELASQYRTDILSDLNARHRETIGGEEGTTRVGEIYCLLHALKRQEMDLKWEYEVYRILNVFDDNTYMYQLQLHRPDMDER